MRSVRTPPLFLELLQSFLVNSPLFQHPLLVGLPLLVQYLVLSFIFFSTSTTRVVVSAAVIL